MFEECNTKNKSEKPDKSANSAKSEKPAKTEQQLHESNEPFSSHVPAECKLRVMSIRIERDLEFEQKLLEAMHQDSTDTMEDDIKEPEFVEPERRYPKRNRIKRFNISPVNSATQSDKEFDGAENVEEKLDLLYSWYKVSIFDYLSER